VTTTSGLAWKIPGRAGDSPIVGAGQYTDNTIGAAGSTGLGEANIMVCGGFLTVEHMRQGMKPVDACLASLKRVVAMTPPRLLTPEGRPTFQLQFYAVNGGRLAAPALSDPPRRLRRRQRARSLDGVIFEGKQPGARRVFVRALLSRRRSRPVRCLSIQLFPCCHKQPATGACWWPISTTPAKRLRRAVVATAASCGRRHQRAGAASRPGSRTGAGAGWRFAPTGALREAWFTRQRRSPDAGRGNVNRVAGTGTGGER
jgi:hypothetical protein